MKQLPPNAPRWTAVGLVVLGLLVIYLGWNGAAGPSAAVDLRAQVPYLLSGGAFGLALVGAGLVLVRTYEARRDARDLGDRLDRLTAAVEQLVAAQAPDLGENPVTENLRPRVSAGQRPVDAL